MIGAHAIRSALAKGNRSAFTVPLLGLIDQTVERFVECGIRLDQIGVVQAEHPLRRPHAPVQICSVQTLAKREFPMVDCVFVDESHLQYATIYEWMDARPELVFVGFSATPWAKGMSDHYDALVVPATIKQMIDEGRLCRFRALAAGLPDVSKVKVEAGDYQVGALSKVMSQKSIVADVVSTWLAKAENRPTLLFAVDRAHAAKLHDEFADIGVASAYIDANTTREDREAVKTLFHRGDIKVVCSVETMIAGIDWDVRCISFCRPTKSPILLTQAFGRGLRTADGKDHLLFLDHSGSTLDLGLPTEIHYAALLGGKKSSGGGEAQKKPMPSPRKCPVCDTIVPATERQCECGHRFQFVSKVVTHEGELEEFGVALTKTQKKLNQTWNIEERAAFHGQLRHYGLARGYKAGWASMKYKDRFGVFPDYPAIKYAEPRTPSADTLIWLRGQKIRYAIAQKVQREKHHHVN